MSKDRPQSVTLETCERQLDRTHAFFPRIDGKVTALFAIASAQIAVAVLNISYDDLKVWWITVPAAVFLLIIGWAIICLYWCAFPHLDGGQASLVYFREIAKLREADYSERYLALNEDDLRKDVVGQIWRNSQIVATKFKYLKNATVAQIVSLIPWTLLLLAVSLSHGRMISVG